MSSPQEGHAEGGWERDERTVAWVYGSMLTGAAVVVAGAKVATRPWQVMAYTAVAMTVVWLAHAYAAFVGHGGRVEGGELGRRVAHALRSELPVLASALPALAAMALAAALGDGISGVGYAGVAAAVATMAVAAAIAARRSGADSMGVAAGALSACLIGVLLIAAKSALK